jgi:ribosomal protein S18 acetylase RimI-like enzyme
MTEPSDLIRVIERSAYAAWPAEEVSELDGWRMRFTHGVTRRGNSVWTNACAGDLALPDRIAEVERFYRSRQLSPSFQITPLTAPGGLDDELVRCGYLIDAPVSIQTADACRIAALPGTLRVRVERVPFDDWFEISARRGRFSLVTSVYRALLERIGSRAIYALAEVDGQPAAVGLGVLGDGWMGIFSMLSLAEHRRKGAGMRVLSALASGARESGIDHLYLQVERDNGPAVEMYRRAGFVELYGYHYRVAP